MTPPSAKNPDDTELDDALQNVVSVYTVPHCTVLPPPLALRKLFDSLGS